MAQDLRKNILRPHRPSPLGGVPTTKAPWAMSEEEVEELEDEMEGGETVSEMAAPKAGSSSSSFFNYKSQTDNRDHTPLSASSFFSQALEIEPPNNDTIFRAYLTPPSTSSSSNEGNERKTMMICHHGAGASGLSFAVLAKEIRDQGKGELGALSYDARGHGKTRTNGISSERAIDLPLETLLEDLISIIQHLYPDPKQAPSLLLLGHSMGASPILSSSPILQSKGYNVCGVIVIDVVEGTAIESLPLMKSILAKRPDQFDSVEDGIKWHINSHSIRDLESARVSVPSYLAPAVSGIEQNSVDAEKRIWRTDLLATEPYWEGWYRGLSQRFLTARCARLLVLAGQERLDKELMIGQMQGKFQLEVLPDVGHYIHEDDPHTLASTILAFWRRNTQILKLPPKVGAPRGSISDGVTLKRVGEI